MRFLLAVTFLLVAVFALKVAPKGKERVIVLSDIHLGSKWFNDGGKGLILQQLLKELTNTSTDIGTVMFLGDTYEFWNYKFSHQQPTNLQVMTSTWENGHNVKAFTDLIAQLCKYVRVIFFIGNHDMEMTRDDLEKAMGTTEFLYVDRLVENGIRYEHGHFKDLFNIEPPHKPKDPTKRPVGYYISRAATTSGYGTKAKVTTEIKIMRSLDRKVFGPMFVTVLSHANAFIGVLKKALSSALQIKELGVFEKSIIKGGDEDRKFKDVKVGQVVKDYRFFIRDMVKTHGKKNVTEMIKSCFGNYKYWIERTKESYLIYGHTHKPGIDRYQRHKSVGSGKVTYVNAGGWVGGLHTFLDIKFDENKKPWVTLKNYKKSIDESTKLRAWSTKKTREAIKKAELLKKKQQKTGTASKTGTISKDSNAPTTTTKPTTSAQQDNDLMDKEYGRLNRSMGLYISSLVLALVLILVL